LNNKIDRLEGLRGLACLVVVNEHFMKLFFPALFLTHVLVDSRVSGTPSIGHAPWNLLHNGMAAVAVFFVLSGFVLSYSFFSSQKHTPFFTRVLSRYIRLIIPILGSLLIVYALYSMDLVKYWEAKSISLAVDRYFPPEAPEFFDILHDGLWRSLLFTRDTYNIPLWTMKIEFIGSILIFLMLSLFARCQNNKYYTPIKCTTYLVLLSVFAYYQVLLISFVLGMLIADIHCGKFNSELYKTRKYWMPLFIILGLYLLSTDSRGLDTGIHWVLLKSNPTEYSELFYSILGAALLLPVVMHSDYCDSFLSSKFCIWLGGISYSVYLIHAPILASFGSLVFIELEGYSYYVRSGIAISVTLFITFFVSYLFSVTFDRSAIRRSKIICLILKQKNEEKSSLRDQAYAS